MSEKKFFIIPLNPIYEPVVPLRMRTIHSLSLQIFFDPDKTPFPYRVEFTSMLFSYYNMKFNMLSATKMFINFLLQYVHCVIYL